MCDAFDNAVFHQLTNCLLELQSLPLLHWNYSKDSLLALVCMSSARFSLEQFVYFTSQHKWISFGEKIKLG